VRGHNAQPTLAKITYNASDGFRVDSSMREAIRRNAQELVGLLLGAKVRIVHGDRDVDRCKVGDAECGLFCTASC
jgi:hypothetical protein